MFKLINNKKTYKKNILSFKLLNTIPTYLLSNATTLILVFVDGIISGNFIGKDALVGMSIASPVLFICGAFVSIVSRGTAVPLSKALGKMDTKQERSICRTSAIMSVVLMFLFVFLQPILYLFITFGYEPDSSIVGCCTAYCQGIYLANIVGVVSTVGVYILIAHGKSKAILKMTIMEVTCNVVLDLLFVCVLNMGVFGAGLGTSGANLVRACLTIFYLQKDLKFFGLIESKTKLQFLVIVKYGIPTFMFNVLPTITIIFINYIVMAVLGDEGLLAKSLAMYALQLVSIVTASVTSTLGPLLGLSKGTNDSIGEKKLIRLALSVSFALALVIVVTLLIRPQLLFLIFGAKDTTEFTFFLFRFFAVSFVFSALNDVFSCYLIYSDKKLYVTIVNCICSVFVLLFFITLFAYLKPELLYVSYIICEIIKLALYTYMYAKISSRSESSKIIYYKFHDTESKNETSEQYLNLLQDTLKRLGFKNNFTLWARLLAEEVIFFNRFIDKQPSYLKRFGMVIFEDKILFYSIDNGQKWDGFVGEDTNQYVADNYIIAKRFSDIFNYSYIMNLNYFSYSINYSIDDTNFSIKEYKNR